VLVDSPRGRDTSGTYNFEVAARLLRNLGTP
jgi:hypothetical protein